MELCEFDAEAELADKLQEKMVVRLLDKMGSDLTIYQSAKMSFDDIDRKPYIAEMERLIRYMWWHGHSSPFEMAEMRFYIEIPIYVARQLVRHRTANLNEVSRRFVSSGVKFMDQELRNKADVKQGSGDVNEIRYYRDCYNDSVLDSLENYEKLGEAIAPECARSVLPLSTMTKMVWKMDLRNLFHFIDLRNHPHAQKEMQSFASSVECLVEQHYPTAYKAFKDKQVMEREFIAKGYDFYKNDEVSGWVDELSNFNYEE